MNDRNQLAGRAQEFHDEESLHGEIRTSGCDLHQLSLSPHSVARWRSSSSACRYWLVVEIDA